MIVFFLSARQIGCYRSTYTNLRGNIILGKFNLTDYSMHGRGYHTAIYCMHNIDISTQSNLQKSVFISNYEILLLYYIIFGPQYLLYNYGILLLYFIWTQFLYKAVP